MPAFYRVRIGDGRDGCSVSLPAAAERRVHPRSLALLWLLGSVLCVISSFASAQDSSTTRAAAGEPELRIVSCAPNLTETLFALGFGEHVVGVTPYCEFPPAAKEKPKIGDLFRPNLEAMAAARPTHILMTTSHDKVASFFGDKEGVELLVFEHPDSIDEINGTILSVGRSFGQANRARAMVAETNSALEEIAEQRTTDSPPSVLIVIGRDQGRLSNLYVAGHGGYLDELLEIAGARNALPENLTGYPVLNREILVTMRPDIVIETHHAEDSEAVRKEIARAWSSVSGIDADKVEVLPDKHLLLPGAYLERDAKTLRDLIHSATEE